MHYISIMIKFSLFKAIHKRTVAHTHAEVICIKREKANETVNKTKAVRAAIVTQNVCSVRGVAVQCKAREISDVVTLFK